MDDLNLCTKYMPVFHKDKYEKEELTNLNEYVINKTIVHDNSLCCHIRKDADRTFIYYFSYYTRDDGIAYFGHEIESHPYDLEQVVIEISANDHISGVYYFPHGAIEHFKISGNDLNFVLQDNRPLVYSSRGKHAQYAISGRIFRYFGAANDICTPIKIDTKCVMASDYLLNLSQIDNVFAGIKDRIVQDLSLVNSVPLNLVRYHMAFVVPKAVKTSVIANKVPVAFMFFLVLAIAIIVSFKH